MKQIPKLKGEKMKMRKRKLIMSRARMAFFAMTALLLFSMFASVSASGSSSSDIITIIRDNYGVPHVFASTREGLALRIDFGKQTCSDGKLLAGWRNLVWHLWNTTTG